MVRREFETGFVAIPYDAVTLNGHPLAVLNVKTEPYDGPWALIAPCGKAVDGESNSRPYLYRTLAECTEDSETLVKTGYSVCP